MLRALTLALAAGLFVLGAAGAADKADKPAKPAKPIGTWTKKVDDASISFAIKPDVLVVTLKRGDQKVEAEADYAVTKDGVLFGRIRKVSKDDGGPSEGDLFSFCAKVEKDKLVISDLKGTHGNEEARNLVEGEYTKSK